LREGEYDLTIEPKSLPEFATVDKTTAQVSLRGGIQAAEPIFILTVNKPQKPIHRSVEKP